MIFSNKRNSIGSLYRFGIALGIWSAVYWILVWYAGKILIPVYAPYPFWVIDSLGFISSMFLVVTTLYLVDTYLRLSQSVASLFGFMLIFAVIDHYTNQVSLPIPIASFIVNLSILGIAFNLGKLIGLAVNERSYLVPLALVSSVADLWSVFAGPTATIIATPDYYNYFLIAYPRIGSPGLYPIIGIGDFTFLALFLTLTSRFNLRARITGWGIIISFTFAILLSVIGSKGIPVIPFMSAAFLAVNWDLLEFKKKDIKTTFIFIIIFFIIVISFTYFAKPRVPNILPTQTPTTKSVPAPPKVN